MSAPRLAILIPTIDGREAFFEAIWNELQRQIARLEAPGDVAILINKDDQTKTIGRKRNELMEAAIASGATHRAFIDDDDMICESYLALNLPGIYGGFDCNSLRGKYYLNGVYDRPFHHSIQYTHWWHDAACYYRNPNHLNITRIEPIKHLRFQEKSFGEDGCFSEDVAREGLLKTEYEVNETVYHYYDRTKPPHEVERLARQSSGT